ncbi:MAG TPA: formate dehydrogenase accessory sulfurtransferase FdhD [Thermoanaerobaculia bacterium]|nr:formate dehydrogenase accessory sulfurtransferase FdhD [Thermoanaerobaculia bacterium]
MSGPKAWGPPGESPVELLRVRGSEARPDEDRLAGEEPLEIRLRAGGEERSLALTMRTPGADFELAVGFLATEGVVKAPEEIARVFLPEDAWAAPGDGRNVVVVELTAAGLPELARLERHFFASSACGVCGRAGIENLRLGGLAPPEPGFEIAVSALYRLPAALKERQGVFARTGGLHAAGLFSATGELLDVAEDVGRHNALDKLLGRAFRAGGWPLSSYGVLVSGRASFEIVQKSLAAGVSLVASISAPSSLAVLLAQELGLGLASFLRDDRVNLYSVPERVRLEP